MAFQLCWNSWFLMQWPGGEVANMFSKVTWGSAKSYWRFLLDCSASMFNPQPSADAGQYKIAYHGQSQSIVNWWRARWSCLQAAPLIMSKQYLTACCPLCSGDDWWFSLRCQDQSSSVWRKQQVMSRSQPGLPKAALGMQRCPLFSVPAWELRCRLHQPITCTCVCPVVCKMRGQIQHGVRVGTTNLEVDWMRGDVVVPSNVITDPLLS